MEIIFLILQMPAMYIGLIPAFLFNTLGPTLTLIITTIFCGFLIYKARISQTKRISLFFASLILILGMIYVGFFIMSQHDAQTAIWMVFGGGLAMVLSVATYFLTWGMLVLIRYFINRIT